MSQTITFAEDMTAVNKQTDNKDKDKRGVNVEMTNRDIYQEMQIKAVRRSVSVKQYINDLTVWKKERDEVVRKLFPDLTKMAYDEDENVQVLADTKSDRLFRISFNGKKLVCSGHPKEVCCEHIHFATSTLDYPSLCKSVLVNGKK